MNHFYGARFTQSFKSDEHWYEINHAGGKALLVAAIIIGIFGILGLFVASSNTSYQTVGVLVLLASVLFACGWNYFQARKIDKDLTKKSVD
ncbi:hypothetical protein CA11_28920 [Gimesia maris]|uniref:SdpI family protein n=1 Tax=Gimesia maris TaxID=122 RepID=UPI00118962AE|nr:SdpI family protein [Gimesia maris]QDU15073.1 hypothetical protein CA11_28920 [Gimesia maris]